MQNLFIKMVEASCNKQDNLKKESNRSELAKEKLFAEKIN